ncbi:unnamed protein product [Rotaria socialis]|uniref:DYW domain-containing protein n=2 Tax=Rotaria socialis TaxID=392032 RepID=A0A817R4Y2_9BILA|nr:unnamed protein product [Rotaria socialis]CAF4868574.1 unnamed protein product [Rotaria socialis]
MKKLSDNGQFKKAIDLYEDQVKKDKNQNTSLAVNQALKSCIDLDDIKRGKYIHENLSSTRKKNPFIQANLIRLYMKCGDYEKSKQIFIDSNNKTTNMLNNILKGLADNSRHEEALNLFKEIDIKTDEYTFKFGQLILDRMPKEFHKNIVVITAALQMFIKCGDISKAEELFNAIENKNLFTFSTMMNGFILNKQEQRAIDLFFQIKKPSKAILRIFFNACAQLQTENALTVGKNVFDQLAIDSNESKDVLNMALNIFIKCGDLKSAECLFNRIDRTIICYGSMMKLYNIKDQPEKTLELFQRMKQETLIPDEICYVLLIDALSKIGDLSLGQSFLCGMPKHFLSNSWIQVALIDIWGKVGSPDKSKEIFDMIEHPDRVAFGAMINAYGLNGMGLEAIESFNRIPSNMLDNVIYICALNACSHSALIGQAWEIFEKIPLNQRTEQIYTTMVDTISRVSLFDQALELIDEYEQSHNPSIPMYMSILSSARNAKNVSLSEKVFHCIESNFPNNESYLTSARILLANAYSLSGNKLTSSNVRVKVNQSSEKKVAGCSWTVVNGKRFRAHEKSNPYSSQIFKESTRLIDRLIKHGYKPDESWITRELNDCETVESVLCGHSERLAIVFNLLQRPIPTRIQIVQNLRICGDCRKWKNYLI